MLMQIATLTVEVRKGKNVAERRVSGRRRIERSGVVEYEPIYTGALVDGLPFGDAELTLPAPIDLQIGDELGVSADEPRVCLFVRRAGAVVWQADGFELERRLG